MALTLPEAKASASAAAVSSAWEFVFSNVPLTSFQAAIVLNAAFIAQNRPNAAAMLTPIFAFVSEVQERTQQAIGKIAAASDVDSVWTQRETLDFSGIVIPTNKIWSTPFPPN